MKGGDMKNIPNQLLNLTSKFLLQQFRPRFSVDGAIQIACPHFIVQRRVKIRKTKYGDDEKIYFVNLCHRMKVHLGKQKWWCPTCRTSGPLSTLPIFVKTGTKQSEDQFVQDTAKRSRQKYGLSDEDD